MTCARKRLRKLRFIASVFLETNDDMYLGKTEEIEIHRFCFLETNDDMCLGKTGEIEVHRSCFLETNDDMCLGKTEEILVQASPEFSTTAMTHEPTRLCCLMIFFFKWLTSIKL